MTADDMRQEAAAIAAARPDAVRSELEHVVPAVTVTLPATVPAGAQIAVHHRGWGVDVDYRLDPRHGWMPIHFVGGSFTVAEDATADGRLLPCEGDCPDEVAS